MSNVLVTGANSTIGATIAAQLAADGHTVLATYHERNDRISAVANNADSIHVAGPFDIRSVSDIEQLRQQADSLNGLSGIVNGASYSAKSGWYEELLKVTPEMFLNTFDVDVVGTLRLITGVQPCLLPNSSIVLFGSSGARRSDLDTAIYNPAKEAVASLGLHLSKILAPATRVNILAPGAIGSEWIESWGVTSEEISEFKAIKYGLQRLGTPNELTQVVQFLLSSRSSYVNGQVIAVDGGSQL